MPSLESLHILYCAVLVSATLAFLHFTLRDQPSPTLIFALYCTLVLASILTFLHFNLSDLHTRITERTLKNRDPSSTW